MSNRRRNAAQEHALVPLSWREGMFVVIQIVVVALVMAGYDLPTTLAFVVGTGLAAGHVIGQVFDPSLPARETR